MKTDIPTLSVQMDEIEDLTLFADESFDTYDVNLFEFTEEQDSPLTHLKTIILSLDWEINDDILQELSNEVERLQQIREEDKISLVYLQGLAKTGRYLQKEGAYAHPNAIRLLLSFFYNFEKIISSPDIPEDSITALLKADVRKFKILQYQIEQRTKQATDLPGREVDQEELKPDHDTSKAAAIILLKKDVLALEWEITDSTIQQLSVSLTDVQSEFTSDEYARIIIQGLQVLVRYLDDERDDAHPDAVNLIHSFFDGLELLAQENISEKERKDILIARVNGLNNLKISLIAFKQQEQPNNKAMETENNIHPTSRDELFEPQAERPVADEIIDKLIDEESEITSTSQATLSDSEKDKTGADDKDIEELESSAITPVLSGSDEMIDFYKEKTGQGDLFTDSETMELAPALSDANEMSGFNEEKAGAEINDEPLLEINDKLDAFFGEDETKKAPEKAETFIEASLSTPLSDLFIAPSPEAIKQNQKTVRDLLDSSAHNPAKTALLQLLDSTLALLPKEIEKLSEDTTEILGFLQDNIQQKLDDPKIIAVAVARFTSWHKNFIEETFLPQRPIPAPEKTAESSELHQEIQELKRIMLEEIGSLRQEIHKR